VKSLKSKVHSPKRGADPVPPGARLWTLHFRLWTLIFFFISWTVAQADDSVSKEYQIKAAYLYNFAKFVEWPAQSFTNARSPLVIGILGKAPIGQELQAIARDHNINGRNIVIKAVADAAEAGQVQLLFFGNDANSRVVEMLAALKGGAVLTVGESDKFIAAGGLINFVREADKVRFEINAAAAEHAGLKISAQLLKLAKPVHTPPDPKP